MARIARIGTTGMALGNTGTQESLRLALSLGQAAGSSGCDLFLLPEMFVRNSSGGGVCLDPQIVTEAAEALSSLAQQHAMYIIAGLPIWEQGKLYNAAYLYDRQGQRVGLYRKIHPTESEMEDGISPGCTPTAFDLDFGRVGVTICFDIGWPAEWQALAELHPDVVCWLSAYDGGFPLQCYAWTGRHYIVTSVWSTDARFIDITGNIISRTGQWTRLAIEDLNLDRELFHVQTNWLQLAEIQNRYGNAVRVRGYTEEGCFVLDLREESVTMKQLSAEFGLEPFDDFHGRIGKMQDQRRGEPIGSPMAMGSQARVQ